MAVIALLTDFGTSDWFVGSMKGVILGIMPDARIIDISHGIAQGDIHSAAFVLSQCYRNFPAQTVFCVVVDPGVGSEREALAAKAGDYYLVGPDNGVLSFVLSKFPGSLVQRVQNRELFYSSPSATFHGRDIFAPVAAHLAAGVNLEQTGPRANEFKKLAEPSAHLSDKAIKGKVIYIDKFGNAFTSITLKDIQKYASTPRELLVGSHPPIAFHRFYSEVPSGEPLALINSSGYLELAINLGNAAEMLGLSPGMEVVLRMAK